MTRLIGRLCKRGNALSRPVLMGRGLDGYFSLLACVQFSSLAGAGRVSHDFGGHSEGETPLPIPNRAVKPLSADGTWWATAWESRSPPVLLQRPPSRAASAFPDCHQPTDALTSPPAGNTIAFAPCVGGAS